MLYVGVWTPLTLPLDSSLTLPRAAHARKCCVSAELDVYTYAYRVLTIQGTYYVSSSSCKGHERRKAA